MIKKILITSFSLIAFIVLFSSCKSYDNIEYFGDIDYAMINASKEISKYDPVIKPDDILGISISAVDPSAVAPFNLPFTTFQTPGEENVTMSQTLQTYLVDSEGNIQFPVLGTVHVEGMTKVECVKFLENLLSKYVSDPIVTINLMNFRVVVLGEVMTPGVIDVKTDKISILEAIGKAGDLTLFGKRDNVLLIRDNNGKREIYRFDLNKSDLFASDYYFLKQNDVIYVQPNKYKEKNARYSQRDAYNVSVYSAIISTLSVIASLIIALTVK